MAANGIDTSVEPTADLYATFIYLDSSERKRFSQSSHEYLVTVTQFTGAETISPGASTRTTNIRLNMNHPVKQLAWVLKGSNHGSFTVGPRGTDNDRWAALSSAKLQLNGHDRFDERKGSYFNTAQVCHYDPDPSISHHTRTLETPCTHTHPHSSHTTAVRAHEDKAGCGRVLLLVCAASV